MTYVIDSIENDEQPVRNYSGQNGTVYVFKVTTTEGALAEVGKQKGKPQKGDTYKTLRMPSEKAPEGALPTLQDKDFDSSPAPVNDPQNGLSGQVKAALADGGRQKSITRQGAQQRAALYLIAKALCKQHGVDLDIDEFTRLVGVFERDATGEQA